MSLVVPGIEELQEVGRGGAGVVYRAWQPEFGRWVAVKVFPADEDVRRLERERLAVGRISDHPGIVPVLDGGVTSDGRPYLIMAYMDGGSLSDRVRAAGPLSAPELVAFGTAMAGALQVAHENGIWHRDIKPANILYDRFGAPRLADFGIAHIGDVSFRTQAGMLSGTIAYMAPELIDGQPFTAASDVFSLGATLYFALEGHHLFEPRPEEAYAAFVVRRITTPHAPVLSPTVPAWLRDVVVAATEPDPFRRLSSAAVLRDALAGGLPQPHLTDAGPPRDGGTPGPGPGPVPFPAPFQAPPDPHSISGRVPPPWGWTPTPPPLQPTYFPADTGSRPRGRRGVAVGAAAAALTAVAVGAWALSPSGRSVLESSRATSPAPTAPTSGTASGGGTVSPAPAAKHSPAASTTDFATSGAPTGLSGAAAISAAVAAYRKAAGGGNPLALEMDFYATPDQDSSAYAIATLPEPAHPALADKFTYRDGVVQPGEPVTQSEDIGAAHQWHFDDVNWSAMGSMLKGADGVCRSAMSKAKIPDQPDDMGHKAGVSYVIVERDTVFNGGKLVVRVYFDGGARWDGGYVLYAATGKLMTARYCQVD